MTNPIAAPVDLDAALLADGVLWEECFTAVDNMELAILNLRTQLDVIEARILAATARTEAGLRLQGEFEDFVSMGFEPVPEDAVWNDRVARFNAAAKHVVSLAARRTRAAAKRASKLSPLAA